MKKQILLIQPWIEDFYLTECRMQPVGLAYLAGAIRKKFPGFQVVIYDTLRVKKRTTIAWPKDFHYLKPFYRHISHNTFSLFHQYYRFGESEEEIVESLKKFDPFLIGVSCMFSAYYKEALKCAGLCKKVFPFVPLVMGGSHATEFPESLFERPFANVCDYVLRGECEESICELLEFLTNKRQLDSVSNLITPEQQHLPLLPLKKPDRSAIPDPDFSSLSVEDYLWNKKPMSFLVTSRSCPYGCSFCSVHTVFGRSYFTRKTDDLLREIKQRFQDGIRHFDIEDDNFTFHKEHATDFLTRLKLLSLPVSFSLMNGVCYWTLDKTLIEMMKVVGFEWLNLAIVSHKPSIVSELGRFHNLDLFKQITSFAFSIRFWVSTSFILGLPEQDLEEIWKTVSFLSRLPTVIQPSPFYLIPKREWERSLNEFCFLASGTKNMYAFARLTAINVETKNFTRKDIVTFWRICRMINYLKKQIDSPGFIPDQLRIPGFKRGDQSIETGENDLLLSERVIKMIKGDNWDIHGVKTGNILMWDAGEQMFRWRSRELPN